MGFKSDRKFINQKRGAALHARFIMKFLKVKTENGIQVLVTLQNVSSIVEISENTTDICFQDLKDYIRVPMPLKDIEQALTVFDENKIINLT